MAFIDWLLLATFAGVTGYLWANIIGWIWAIVLVLAACVLILILPNDTQNLRQPRRVAMWAFVMTGVTGTFLTVFVGRTFGFWFALILLSGMLLQVLPMVLHQPKK